MRTLAVALLLVLAGCGGGGETPEPKATATATKATAKATIAAPTGTPAPEALSLFRCAKDTKGRWRASGTIANDGKKQATYQVTVYIGEAAGSDEKAKTKQLANIQAGGSAKFVIVKVPAPKDGGPCHVQVLRR
ncbi:hypothetical protein J2X11_000012 [Aeromicrobium panaciterrae]|uniref:Uncharacterized protein n=1 Tax=Aeromicrobium panaciterrae TaxID=363861 RepID=A0ABU1UJ10_9ACTN|nr:hypothetical protein [Aeromicrobium panaciterrae]MDR7085173.1 hypothetical protein [Aeromicrobium panaciterrae]